MLYQNDGNSNHWLKLRLRSNGLNRFAVGAKAWIQTGDVTQYRELTDATSARHQGNEQIVHFGVGAFTTIDSLTVEWPSGLVETYTGVPADQDVILVEGSDPPWLPTPTQTSPNTATGTATQTPTGTAIPSDTPTQTPTGTPIPSDTPTPNSDRDGATVGHANPDPDRYAYADSDADGYADEHGDRYANEHCDGHAYPDGNAHPRSPQVLLP